jgi:hypothetical protein
VDINDHQQEGAVMAKEAGQLGPAEMRAAQQQVIGLLASIVHGEPAGTRMMLEGWSRDTTVVLATLAITLAAKAEDGDVEGWLQGLGRRVSGIRPPEPRI